MFEHGARSDVEGLAIRPPSAGLVVEVDGGVHRSSRGADRRRDEKLQRLGYRVVRVNAALVLRDSEAVVSHIRASLP